MPNSDAHERFQAASNLYTAGAYADALEIIQELVQQFPDNVNLLKALARTLAKLGRTDEAVAICDRLESEFGYARARAYRDRITGKSRDDVPTIAFEPPAADDEAPPVELTELGGDDEDGKPAKRRFRIKPVRLGLLLLVCAGMYYGYVSYWVGGGLIVAYFAVRLALGKLFVALFSVPFRMKGKALAGASAELHSIEWTARPAKSRDDEEDEEDVKGKGPLRYAWLDVTITPPVRTQGFTHWEPGELMVAPTTTKLRKLDDMDKCFRIHGIKYLVDGQLVDDEGHKIAGPQRLKLLAEFPESAAALQFCYYGYAFGNLAIR